MKQTSRVKLRRIGSSSWFGLTWQSSSAGSTTSVPRTWTVWSKRSRGRKGGRPVTNLRWPAAGCTPPTQWPLATGTEEAHRAYVRALDRVMALKRGLVST